MKTNAACKPCDQAEVAPDLKFTAVLTNTPLAGKPPANHEARFAIASAKISFPWTNFDFVTLSATLAEMRVSSKATIATTKPEERMFLIKVASLMRSD